MFIEPIKPIQGIGEINDLQKSTNPKEKNDMLFKSIFEEALNNYVGAEAQVDEDIYKLSVGESDDLHNLMINTKKAEMSLDLVIQLRNKALDAYNEIMRMGV
ncbi:flagellar hook-basal body complex protein FliE [Sedimentibacter hydroxybenzoicus DSM 7310]|uniref:Flagellar hook-basal body complex protein FliE n=1 Tax=Sedimentibacter hydroxybenzoicus DSM 7310 TaxID=1123245 RepID=A0A974BGB2_SEDHY|nr:flagellar hook-basal body complex protein FliE [Sedimentibacter hydroxybenzoicus]NYB72589.1 flagellar hook-basal body complex protein FliE [Sedimentibacter hydroxybenzoicus DSM 7310]